MLLTCRSISFKAKWITFIARLASNVRGGRRKRQHGTTRNNDNHIHTCHCTPSHYRKLVPVNNITKPEAPAMSSSSTDSNKIRTMLFRRNGCNASDLTDNDVKEEIDHLQRLYVLALDEVRGVVVMYERRKTRVTTTLMQQSHLHSWILHKTQWGRCTTKGTALQRMKPLMIAQTHLCGCYQEFQTSIKDVIYVWPSFQNSLICKSNTTNFLHHHPLPLDHLDCPYHHYCLLLIPPSKVPLYRIPNILFAMII